MVLLIYYLNNILYLLFYLIFVKFSRMDAYVAALEAKLAEVSGIKVNQIANAASEGAAIAEATEYIKNINVVSQGQVKMDQV